MKIPEPFTADHLAALTRDGFMTEPEALRYLAREADYHRRMQRDADAGDASARRQVTCTVAALAAGAPVNLQSLRDVAIREGLPANMAAEFQAAGLTTAAAVREFLASLERNAQGRIPVARLGVALTARAYFRNRSKG
ncbi:MAG: hypothetical protein KF863_10385 [Rubrivivax sp.]|nr:hypothetical protein [Rubrivivax sp.]